MQVYSYREGEKLVDRFLKRGGVRVCCFAKCLVDSYLITADKCKTAVIKGHYLNEWSSGVTIRMYNKCPSKYERVFELYEAGEYEKAEKLFFSK